MCVSSVFPHRIFFPNLPANRLFSPSLSSGFCPAQTSSPRPQIWSVINLDAPCFGWQIINFFFVVSTFFVSPSTPGPCFSCRHLIFRSGGSNSAEPADRPTNYLVAVIYCLFPSRSRCNNFPACFASLLWQSHRLCGWIFCNLTQE